MVHDSWQLTHLLICVILPVLPLLVRSRHRRPWSVPVTLKAVGDGMKYFAMHATAADYSKGTVDGRLAAEPISLYKDLSVCDSALRMKSSVSASGKLGARAAITGRRA